MNIDKKEKGKRKKERREPRALDTSFGATKEKKINTDARHAALERVTPTDGTRRFGPPRRMSAPTKAGWKPALQGGHAVACPYGEAARWRAAS